MNAWDKDTGNAEKVEVTPAASPDTAWDSTKQELPSQEVDQPLHAATTDPLSEQQPQEEHRKPSLPRLLLRVWQFFASIGAFGFQVGATPVS